MKRRLVRLQRFAEPEQIKDNTFFSKRNSEQKIRTISPQIASPVLSQALSKKMFDRLPPRPVRKQGTQGEPLNLADFGDDTVSFTKVKLKARHKN